MHDAVGLLQVRSEGDAGSSASCDGLGWPAAEHLVERLYSRAAHVVGVVAHMNFGETTLTAIDLCTRRLGGPRTFRHKEGEEEGHVWLHVTLFEALIDTRSCERVYVSASTHQDAFHHSACRALRTSEHDVTGSRRHIGSRFPLVHSQRS